MGSLHMFCIWISIYILANINKICAQKNGGIKWNKTKIKIKIGALLPEDNKWPFDSTKMLQAASLGFQYVHAKGILSPNIDLMITSRDSNCSEANGMNQAINFKYKDNVSAFFGPTCDFAAAPVARQVTFWNLPMVSVGAMAGDFKTRRRSVYPLLTTAGTINLHSLANWFVKLMLENQWQRFKLVYDRLYDGNSVAPIFCHLVSQSLVYEVPAANQGISLDYWQLQDNTPIGNITEKLLLDEISTKYSGETVF